MAGKGKTRQIYDTLKDGGADVGSFQEFSNWFYVRGKQGYENRRSTWQTLNSGGADAGKSYEEFAGWLGLHAVKSSTRAATSPALPKPLPSGFGQLDLSSMSPRAQYVGGKYNPIEAGRRHASAQRLKDATLAGMADRGNGHAARAIEQATEDREDVEKPCNFDPFGQAVFAHLGYRIFDPCKVLVQGSILFYPFRYSSFS